MTAFIPAAKRESGYVWRIIIETGIREATG
jgi:hypothetical protein